MKYLFLLWQDESKAPKPGTPESDAVMGAYNTFSEQAGSAGVLQGGEALLPSTGGQTVRVRNGSTDAGTGPFSAGPEQLVGFYSLDCKDDADAAAWAARIPASATGAVEVRPIWVM
ncbi:MAG: YciI family protein [Candidatus Dormibacteraeota bacterium]|nr:YciI family protein [Candidatus Dormibacteraeota bacterium]